MTPERPLDTPDLLVVDVSSRGVRARRTGGAPTGGSMPRDFGRRTG